MSTVNDLKQDRFESREMCFIDEYCNTDKCEEYSPYARDLGHNSSGTFSTACDNNRINILNGCKKIDYIIAKDKNTRKKSTLKGKLIACIDPEMFNQLTMNDIHKISTFMLMDYNEKNTPKFLVINTENESRKSFKTATDASKHINMKYNTFNNKKNQIGFIHKEYIVISMNENKEKSIGEIESIINKFKQEIKNKSKKENKKENKKDYELNPEILINNEVDDELKKSVIRLLMKEKGIDEPMAELLVNNKGKEYLEKMVLDIMGF